MKKNHYAVMRKNILASMILVPIIPFILVLIIGYSYFTSSIENSTISSMSRIVEDHRQMIESFLKERRANLEFILRSHSFEEVSRPEKLRELFDLLERQSSTFVDIGVFNADGVHVAYQGPYQLTGKIYKDADWFAEVMRKGYYISDVFLGFRKIPHFIIAVARAEGDKKWVIRATIDTHMFNSLVKKVRMGQTGEAYLLNREGVFQTERRSGGNLMQKAPDHTRYPAFSSPASSGGSEGIRTFIRTDTTGNKHLYTTTWMKNKQWLLVVRQEKADAFSTLRTASFLIILTLIGGGIIIVAVAFYLTHRIITRMQQTDAEKGQLEEQLVRAHRLAELGQMAAGFAHEINNPLQIIKSEHSLIELILSDMKTAGELKASEPLGEVDDSMDQISLQIERCAKITQAILKFGRQSKGVAQDVDLREFIPEVSQMIEKKASVNGVRMTVDVAEKTPVVFGDPGQLQQVLLNLYNNALDAIEGRHGAEGGELTIQAMPSEKGMVDILVKDNGAGISPEDQENIFSPFFTTKPVGKGTGLGLSVCYGIIDKMGGQMTVSSKRGTGTTFKVQLPAHH